MKIFEYAAKTRSELLNRNLLQLELWSELAKKFKIEEDSPEFIDGFRKFATYFNKYREEYGIDMDDETLKNRYIFKKIKETVFE